MNKIFNEDIMSFLNNRVENESADLIIADPPYNILKEDWDTFESYEKYMDFMKNWIKISYQKLKQGGTIYLFNNSYNSAKLINILESFGFTFQDWIIWYKKDGFGASKKKYVNNQETILFFTKGKNFKFNYDNIRVPYSSESRISHAMNKGILKNGKRWFPNINGKLCSNVWEFSSHRHNVKVSGKIVKSNHPTPKPEAMIKRMIIASSNENDLVLDLFSGSGTTSYICSRNNRFFLGCELNEKYFNYAINRLENGDK